MMAPLLATPVSLLALRPGVDDGLSDVPPPVALFLDALAQHHPPTYRHSLRVGVFAQRFAAWLGLEAPLAQLAWVAGLLHDIGKLNLPPSLLDRHEAQPLGQVERHVMAGVALLRIEPTLAPLGAVIVAHHEQPDGLGFPRGLTAAAIPPLAAMLAIVNGFDRLDRHYPHRLLGPTDAITELRRGTDTIWDGALVEAFVSMLRDTVVVPTPCLPRPPVSTHSHYASMLLAPNTG